MKKVILGILSILFISPVFAVDYSPSWTYNTAISFESLTQNNNITYYLYNYQGDGSYFGYLTNGFSIGQLIPKYLSLEQSGYGYYINSDYVGNIFKFGALNNANAFYSYYSLLAFTLSGGLPKLGYNSLYLQSTSSSITNKLVAFGNNELDFNDSVSLSNSYVRYFYNTGLLFDGLTPNYSDFYSNPVGIQIFGSSLYTLTNKGKVYDYAGVNSLSKNWVLSSYFDSYSYILGNGTGLSFHTVLPGFISFVSGSYNVPKYFETDKFLMFRGDGNKYNGDYSVVGVLSFSGSNILYSKYSCDGLSLTLDDDGEYSYNFNSACSLLDGGILNSGGKVYNSRCGYFDIKDFFGKSYNNGNACNPTSYYGNYLSLSFDSNNNLVLSSLSEINVSNQASNRYSISFPLTSIYGVDILNGFDNTDVPPEPLTTGHVVNVLDTLCSSMLLKPVYCYNHGITDLGSGLDGMWYVDLSGNLVYTVISKDVNNLGSFDLVPNGNGGFDVICTDDLFGCSLVDNLGLSGATIGGYSGFILSTGYYEDFFIKTGYWGKCPYPYTDVNIGMHSKFLNKFNDKLGFDLLLPVNCFIAAFNHGKNFRFLKDVNLGLNPLMGQIQSNDDPRVYLYSFFDFLLSVALFFFLLKLYHLLK